ncbi:MAG: 4-hydroxy-tetrahydrodipicolinate synthase [bacterium]|jgi:4-hydroxy-tetrahydrodipicolinate synthase
MDRIHNACVMTAIKTPYLPNNEIDLEMYDKIVEKQIKHGVKGLIIGGTTGEGHLMDWNEHIMLIAHSVHKFGKDLVIVGNTGSNNTREAIHATKQGFAVGMDASLQINPYYGKTSKKGLIEHLNQGLALGPAIVYNVPGRTGQDIGPDVIEEIAKSPNFVGVKECMGNERIQYYTDKGIATWSGNDDQSFEAKHLHGAKGVISVTSNVIPKLMVQLMTENSPALNEQLQPLFTWLFHEPNPIPLNTALAMMGEAKAIFRRPYYPLSESSQAEGKALLEGLNTEEVGQVDVIAESDFVLV